MIDIKGMVNKLEEDGKPTSEERELLIKSLLLQAKLHNQQGALALGLLFTSAAQEIEALQAENAELKKQSESLKLNLGLCCNHLLLALNLDEIKDEDDKSSIHSKANDFIVSCSETLRGV